MSAISSGATPLDSILTHSVRQAPDIDALATSATGEAAVLLWNYHDDDVAAPGAPVTVSIKSIPPSVHRVLLQHYRIDDHHSNAYTVWKEMGSPQESNPGAICQAASCRSTATARFSRVDDPREWRDKTGCATAAYGSVAFARDLAGQLTSAHAGRKIRAAKRSSEILARKGPYSWRAAQANKQASLSMATARS